MSKPRLLDLFCGAGGAGMGYARAGFEVVGVDVKPQPHYPFEFVHGDAFTVFDALAGSGFRGHYLREFDAIHASPPCQAFTDLKSMYNALPHDNLLTPMLARLDAVAMPWAVENVSGAPMRAAIQLCGTSFHLGTDKAELRRHRLFETSLPMLLAPSCAHGGKPRVIGVYGGHGRDRRRTVNAQDFSTEERREAMGIDWMTGAELSQAIPPAYTEFIGAHLMRAVEASRGKEG